MVIPPVASEDNQERPPDIWDDRAFSTKKMRRLNRGLILMRISSRRLVCRV